MARSKKRLSDSSEEQSQATSTLAPGDIVDVDLVYRALMATVPGTKDKVYQIVAKRTWQRVLKGAPNSMRDWRRLKRLYEFFDEQPAIVVEISGGLPPQS